MILPLQSKINVSSKTISCQGSLGVNFDHEGVVNLVQSAKVEQHQVDHLKDESDNCIGNQKAVVKIQIIVA